MAFGRPRQPNDPEQAEPQQAATKQERKGAGRNGSGADGAANLACVPCLGTGRMTLGEVS